MKHTPGKWKVGTHDRVINRYPIYARIGPVQLARIAVTDGHEVGYGISQAEMTANATLIATAPELAEKLRESIDLLIGAAAWLKSSGQPMVAQGLRKWVAEHGQPTLDRAEGVQDAETD